MAQTGRATPKVENFDLSDTDTDDLFASPSGAEKKSPNMKATRNGNSEAYEPRETHTESRFDTEEAHETALRRELAGIRSINEVIEGVVDSLERAKGNMDVGFYIHSSSKFTSNLIQIHQTVSRTVTNASTLLSTWTRILSQTEHNQRLILKPAWHGASQDVADMENDTVLRRQEKERREIEETQRREATARKVEDDERRRAEAASVRGSRGTRGRGRAVDRVGGSGYVGVGGQGNVRGLARGGRATPGRGVGSGIGRGLNSGRGQGRI